MRLSQLVGLLLITQCAHAEDFLFGRDPYALTGKEEGTAFVGGFELNIFASPSGARFNATKAGGIGVDSSALLGTFDADPAKMNIISSSGAPSGMGESVTFSFEQPGVLDRIGFAGLKDEPLEYFTIEFPDKSLATHFDFETEMRLNDQGFQLSELGVPNPVLAVDASDAYENINYMFEAGEEFTVTYGEVDFATVLPGYAPIGGEIPNGSRLKSISVSALPSCNPDSLGDLNGDGEVAFADFLLLSKNFGTTATSHAQGDIDCDGEVAFADFLVLSNNFGTQVGMISLVPEPSGLLQTLCLFGCIFSCGLCRRRRRRR